MDTESLEEMYKSLSILQAGKQSQEEIHQVQKEVKEKLFIDQIYTIYPFFFLAMLFFLSIFTITYMMPKNANIKCFNVL